MNNSDLPYPFKEFEIGGESFILNVSPEACDTRDIIWIGIIGRIRAISHEKKGEISIEDILTLYKKGLDATFGQGAFDRFFNLCEHDITKFTDLIHKLKVEFLNLGRQKQCLA